MPESFPDFAQIARHILDRTDGFDVDVEPFVIEQLRQIWNARGAADLVTADAELSMLMGNTAAGPYCQSLDRALRSLDR